MKTDPVTFELIKDSDPALTAMENALRHAEGNLSCIERKIEGLEFEMEGARKSQRALAHEVKQLKRSIKIWTGEAL